MDTQQAPNVGALMAGMGIFFFLFVVVILAFVLFLFWRIFAKAGYSGPMAFLLLVPGVGGLIVLCILAFGQWKVVPLASVVPVSGPPSYPPAPIA